MTDEIDFVKRLQLNTEHHSWVKIEAAKRNIPLRRLLEEIIEQYFSKARPKKS